MTNGPVILFFGCWDRPGHYLWGRDGARLNGDDCGLPFGWLELDGGRFQPGVFGKLPKFDAGVARVSAPWQQQHVIRLTAVCDTTAGVQTNPWTVGGFWDRSVDKRYGSCGAFLVQGTHSAAELLALAREAYPQVYRRVAPLVPEGDA